MYKQMNGLSNEWRLRIKEILIDYTEIEWEEAVHMVLLGYKNCN
jgi:hypothetical protein